MPYPLGSGEWVGLYSLIIKEDVSLTNWFIDDATSVLVGLRFNRI